MSGMNGTQRKLQEKWLVQENRSALRALHINGLRGLEDVHLEFRYPVTAIAGVNGSGKTTLLTVAACGYHGDERFVPLNCKSDRPYYTFNDFFVSSRRDGHFAGSTVEWTYFGAPSRSSLKIEKSGAGKWMNYARRPHRAVVYVGLERVLPAAERRVLRRHFGGKRAVTNRGLSDEARKAVNSITSLNYTAVEFAESEGHRIFEMTRGASTYSSFHSGAGEEIVCEIASLLDGIPEDALVLIEEVEAGLHPALQVGLMRHLMEVAMKRRIQVVVTTHSSHVMSSVPPDGRVFLKRLGSGATSVEYGINPVYVLSELTGKAASELVIYVEDTVARDLVRALLPPSLRRRTRVQPLGSYTLLASQAAAYFADPQLGSAIFVVDGDVRKLNWSSYASQFKKAVRGSSEDQDQWLEDRTVELPGLQPERLLWETANDANGQRFLVERGYETEDLNAYAAKAEPPDWHSVPFDFATVTTETIEKATQDLCQAAVTVRRAEFSAVLDRISSMLGIAPADSDP